jgi:hypothetical protein
MDSLTDYEEGSPVIYKGSCISEPSRYIAGYSKATPNLILDPDMATVGTLGGGFVSSWPVGDYIEGCTLYGNSNEEGR